jgi:hypothetical protein
LNGVSFTDAVQLGKNSIRSGELTGFPNLRFGGLNVILIGDFHQLPSVGGLPLPTSLLLHIRLKNCITGDSMVGSSLQPVELKSPGTYVPACVASASAADGKLVKAHFEGPGKDSSVSRTRYEDNSRDPSYPRAIGNQLFFEFTLVQLHQEFRFKNDLVLSKVMQQLRDLQVNQPNHKEECDWLFSLQLTDDDVKSRPEWLSSPV